MIPYRFSNEEREKEQWNNPAHLAAEKNSEEEYRLLKNEKQLLPLQSRSVSHEK